jgi:hypothetical protein
LLFYQDRELIQGTTGQNLGLWNRTKKWIKDETVYKEIGRIIAISTPCFIDLFTLQPILQRGICQAGLYNDDSTWYSRFHNDHKRGLSGKEGELNIPVLCTLCFIL